MLLDWALLSFCPWNSISDTPLNSFVFLIMEPGHHHRLDLQHREPTSYERPANIMIFSVMRKYGSLLVLPFFLSFCLSFFLFLTFCNIPNVVTFLFRQALICHVGGFNSYLKLAVVFPFSPGFLFVYSISSSLSVYVWFRWAISETWTQVRCLPIIKLEKKSPSPSFPARSCPA